jgi:hypothetical protein
VWIDTQSIPGGEEWGIAIQGAIRQSVAVLAFRSQVANASSYVTAEIKIALQHRAQFPTRDFPIIPVLLEPLEHAPLPPELAGLQAVELTDCDEYQAFRTLLRRLTGLEEVRLIKRHVVSGFDKTVPLMNLPRARMIDGDLWLAPLIESVYTVANVAGAGELSVAHHLEQSPRKIQLCIMTKANEDDFSFLQDVHQFVREQFLALYITPKPDGGAFMLDNQRPAQWLDITNTTYEAAISLVGRGGNILMQVFTLAPAVLTFSIGTRFYEYWPMQLYNRVGHTYQMVLDNRDLPYKT